MAPDWYGWGNIAMKIGKRLADEHVYSTKQMTLGNALVQIELVKKVALIPALTPHHPPDLPMKKIRPTELRQLRRLKQFFNSIEQKPTFSLEITSFKPPPEN